MADNQELVWDLRIIYANFIVAPTLVDIAEARKIGNFQKYLKSLDDLYVVIQHKIKSKEKKEPGYPELRQEALKTIKKFEGAFIEADASSQGNYEIGAALQKLEMYLYEKMEEAKMFGGRVAQDRFI